MENRQNTEVNHIQFDYRNTCAMINFTHKPCCADEQNVQVISENIQRKITNVHVNYLENLKNIQFGTKKNPFIELIELDDFPILSEEEMKDEIFFGSYYMKQSRSYFKDIITSDSYCEITSTLLKTFTSLDETVLNNLENRLSNYKIIGMNITSRHRRSLKKKPKRSEEDPDITEIEIGEEKITKYRLNYKVFIEYEKNINHFNAIKSIVKLSNNCFKIILFLIILFLFLDYYCSCKSGKKQAGCCMHVAAYIHYLSFARFNPNIKLPGEHLNSVLIDMEKNQSPKKPIYVKNNRRIFSS